ncbi:MAG TPA: hypothetical protein VH299_03320 [Solirubrobacterales bacterium]|jgi:hypothetical protein|nr:hypothetical protein [Solirubrobacterales bacterium]
MQNGTGRGYSLSSEEFDAPTLHQVGDDQEGLFEFYEREILPHCAD